MDDTPAPGEETEGGKEGWVMGEKIHVPSDRDRSVEYEVDLDEHTCTCPHFQHRLKEANEQDGGKRSCKHLERVRDLRGR